VIMGAIVMSDSDSESDGDSGSNTGVVLHTF